MSLINSIDNKAYDLATDQQRKVVDAVRKHGSHALAAKSLSITVGAVSVHIQNTLKRAAKQGWAPGADLTHLTAAGFDTKRVSTLYGKDGQITAQWHIQEPQKMAQFQMIQDVMTELCEQVTPRKSTVPPPLLIENKDLIVNIPIGDAHVGLLVWAEECGEDYDLGISEQLHKQAVDMIIAGVPAANTCAIIDVGDFMHSDNQDGVTSRSGHSLDMDGRYHKVIRVAIDIVLYYIDSALKKFQNVIFRPEVGNHNDIGSIWMQELLTRYYQNEPRVTIGNTAGNIFYWQWGLCFFASTHGDRKKGERLAAYMSKHIMDNHLETKFRKIYCGHLHHSAKQEYSTCVIETYRTLAAADSYSAGSGYSSERGISAEVWHKTLGMLSMVNVNIPMLEAAGYKNDS